MSIEQIITQKIEDSEFKTKSAFAAACGIANQNISKMIKTPTLQTMERFAGVLHCEVWELLKPVGADTKDKQDCITCPHCGKVIKFSKEE